MPEFFQMYNRSQFVVMEGETGSGKTTQWVHRTSAHI